MSVNVIDISNYNITRVAGILIRDIDWSRVVASPFAPKLVYIKLGEGYWTGYRLDDALRSYDTAGAAGVPYRAWYHYAHPEYAGSTQSAYFRQRAGLRLGELPQIADLEDTDKGMFYTPRSLYTPAQYAAAKVDALRLRTWILDYLHAIDDAWGRMTSVYTGGWWLDWMVEVCQMYGADISDITRRPLLNASYTNTEIVTKGWSQSTIWQYSDTGRVDGIPGAVDMNQYHGTLEMLAGWAAGTTPPPPAPVPQPVTVAYIVINETGTYVNPNPNWGIYGRWVAKDAILQVDPSYTATVGWLKVVSPVIGYVSAIRVKAA